MKCGLKLQSIRDDDIPEIIKTRYFDEINKRLDSVSGSHLTVTHKEDVERRIRRRVEGVRKRLSSDKECGRLARSLVGTPVPEIWEDPHSKNEMIDSFCEYLTEKLDSPTRLPGIVRTLRDGFNLASGDESHEIRRKIDEYFKTGTYNREDWGGDAFGVESDSDE